MWLLRFLSLGRQSLSLGFAEGGASGSAGTAGTTGSQDSANQSAGTAGASGTAATSSQTGAPITFDTLKTLQGDAFRAEDRRDDRRGA